MYNSVHEMPVTDPQVHTCLPRPPGWGDSPAAAGAVAEPTPSPSSRPESDDEAAGGLPARTDEHLPGRLRRTQLRGGAPAQLGRALPVHGRAGHSRPPWAPSRPVNTPISRCSTKQTPGGSF